MLCLSLSPSPIIPYKSLKQNFPHTVKPKTVERLNWSTIYALFGEMIFAPCLYFYSLPH